MPKPFCAYMLLCADKSYYVGSTDDLEKRVAEHASGVGGAYTRKRLPVELVWSQEFATREEAKAAEVQIKGWTRAKKQALARDDFAAVSLLARKDWVAHRERKSEDAEGQDE